MKSKPEHGQPKRGLRALLSGLIPGGKKADQPFRGDKGIKKTDANRAADAPTSTLGKRSPRSAEPAAPPPLVASSKSASQGHYIDPSKTLPIESKIQSQLRRAVGKSGQAAPQPVTLRKPKSIQASPNPAKPPSASALRKKTPVGEIHLPTQLAANLKRPSPPRAEIERTPTGQQTPKPARPNTPPKSLPPTTRSKGRDFPIL